MAIEKVLLVKIALTTDPDRYQKDKIISALEPFGFASIIDWRTRKVETNDE